MNSKKTENLKKKYDRDLLEMLTNSTMLQILGMVDVAICTLGEGEDEVGRCGEWQMTDAWKDRGEGGLEWFMEVGIL